ncbi:MAG TPA: SRPBCC domain-containing protein [Ramlibacter sp.]|nr:SRPBCC domain-containing protein [Ramlibacter sp.]
MEFRIDAVLPASAAQLWAIFFDVQRVATLIPGCENVSEAEPFKEFSAVMKQKIGPFKLEVPTRITIESHTVQRQVVLVAAGSDKFTGTTLDVRMKVDLEEQRGTNGNECRLAVQAGMQVAGRLASLGYPIVKKRSEELFGEFERRLRLELSGVQHAQPQQERSEPRVVTAAAPAAAPAPLPAAVERAAPRLVGVAADGRSELVLLWPRVGISVAVGIAVAHGAVAFGQSPWWWLVAPLLGVGAGLGRRGG